MSERGVYAIDRGIWDDPDFADEIFTEREAWMWLVGAAAWKQVRLRIGTSAVTLERAEFCYSVRFLADKWGWSKSRAARFLERLENRDTIRNVSRDGVQVYFITKYNEFQVVGLPQRDTTSGDDVGHERDTDGTAAGQQRDKEETLQNIRNNTSSLRSEVTPSRKERVEIPEWIPSEPWAAFLEMRRKIRAPLTNRALQLAISDLEKLRGQGEDVAGVLNQSVMRSWRGLFPVKHGDAGGRGGQTGGPDRQGRKPTAHDRFLAGGAALLRELGEDGQGGFDGEGGDGDAGEAGPALLAPRLQRAAG